MTYLRFCSTILVGVIFGLPCTALAEESSAQSPWVLQATYTLDINGAAHGGIKQAGRLLDNLDLIIDGDLDQAMGWKGATAHLYLLNNSGGAPNDVAGTLQGVDNIEVSQPRGRLYEAWVQQSFANDRGSVRVGLYDLNSEFYATEASGLLIAPAFGIGSELASTGPNGPSIFPSTALAVRLKFSSAHGAYGQVAVLNAKASTLGDPDGPQTGFEHGTLTIAEAGYGDTWRVAAGAWLYSDPQPDIRNVDAAGDPLLSEARGGYILVEHALGKPDSHARLFLRAGVSDGDTSPFRSGWQAGVLVQPTFAGRPDSAFSVGIQQGNLSDKQRANLSDGGDDPARAESGIEITYSDRIAPRLSVQPDLQVIRAAGGVRGAETVVVAAVRLTFDLH